MLALRLTRPAAICFLGIAGYFTYEATTYPYADDTGPGAGFFPVWIGMLGLAVGIGLLLTARQAAEHLDVAISSTAIPRPIVGLTVVALTLAALGLETLGFRITTFVLVLALMRLFRASWADAALTGAAASLLVFALFQLLQVRLPVGVFGV